MKNLKSVTNHKVYKKYRYLILFIDFRLLILEGI